MTIPAPFTDQEIADQLTRGGSHWYGNNGDSVIKYSFSNSLGSNWGNTGEYALNAVQQQWVETALSHLSDLFGLTFQEVTPPANTNLTQAYDIIQFVNDTNTGTYSSSYAYTSGPNNGGIVANAIVLDQTWTSNQSANLEYGSYGYMTILHEILHSLGLDHPGSYDAGNGVPITYMNDAEFEQDTHRYTVMSYFDSYEDGSGAAFYDTVEAKFVYPRTPMVYDILAMTSGDFNGQFAGYSENSTTRNTDTTYGYNVTPGIDSAFDFATHGAPVLTIYDTGGIDTLDLSGDTVANEAFVTYDAQGNVLSYGTQARTSTLIDIREGAYSSTHGMTYNIGIAYGTVIENVVATNFHDTVHGNDVANEILGRGGEDILYGYDGDDYLNGGNGNDDLFGGNGDDLLIGGAGADDFDGGTHTAGIGDT
ncbi:MAG: M10 family metallopeptidase C-terminal domain-containing protein, partial [Salaquimonas sp.]